MNPRRQANLASYHQMAKAGMPESAILLAFEEGDIENLQDDIMSGYWAHVRSLLRKVPQFNRKLEFLANFFEKDAHEVRHFRFPPKATAG